MSIRQNEARPYLNFNSWWSTFERVVNPTNSGPALPKFQFMTEYILKGCQSDKIRPSPILISIYDGVHFKRLSIRQNQAWPYLNFNLWRSTFSKVVNPTKSGLALSKLQFMTEYILKEIRPGPILISIYDGVHFKRLSIRQNQTWP